MRAIFLGNSVGWFRRLKFRFEDDALLPTRSHLNPVIDVGDFQTEISYLVNNHISYFRVQIRVWERGLEFSTLRRSPEPRDIGRLLHL